MDAWTIAHKHAEITEPPAGLNEPCWLSTDSLMPNGYARLTVDGVRGYAHRRIYATCVAPVLDGHDIDHLCRRRHCMQPAHLELVTHRENVRRGAKGRLVTVCANGHSYTDESTYMAPNGTRKCRTCRDAARARSRAKLARGVAA